MKFKERSANGFRMASNQRESRAFLFSFQCVFSDLVGDSMFFVGFLTLLVIPCSLCVF